MWFEPSGGAAFGPAGGDTVTSTALSAPADLYVTCTGPDGGVCGAVKLSCHWDPERVTEVPAGAASVISAASVATTPV